MFSRRAGFTLLEICLAMAIGLLLVMLAVPSISGLLTEQRLKQSSDKLEHLVARARVLSVREQRAYALIWEKEAIRLQPMEKKTEVTTAETSPNDLLVFTKGETFTLTRPAALEKNPAPVWTFWPNGLCEPALVSYEGAAGKWQAQYDALTARGIYLSSETR
jgi:prepilin-type N-terminal cleavage/methylation domain-containing protein